MADILFKCPECSKHLVVDGVAQGKIVKCVDCGQSVIVPRSAVAFKCPSCSCDLSAPSDIAGEVFNCPNCEGELSIPTPARSSIPSSSTSTRVCEWCAESIPEKALICPHCTKWRKDIAEERIKCNALAVLAVTLIVLCPVIFTVAWYLLAKESIESIESRMIAPGRYESVIYEFSLTNFLSSPWGWAAIACPIAGVWPGVLARRLANRLNRKAGSLWRHGLEWGRNPR